jgi:hypothetical protein
MATGAIYPPSTTFPAWQYSTPYPHDDPRADYTFYASSQPPTQYTQRQQPYQAWTPPSHYSVDSYQDTPYMHPSGLPSIVTPSFPMRRSLGDDPAFAPDLNTNPDHWFRGIDMPSTAPFPSRSYSASDLPPGFVPQSGPVSDPSPRSHSYHEDTAVPSSVPQPFYFVTSSRTPSSSSDDSPASNSSASRPSQSSARSLDHARHSDSSFHYIPAKDVPENPPDEGKSHPSNAKHRSRRRSAHAAIPANGQAEVSGAVTSAVQQPTAHEDRTSLTVMSSMTDPPPPGLSERPKDVRRRTSSRPTLPDLDSIDELDETNPLGFNLHHKGPYEAIAAVLNEANPVDSPLLRVKGIQQQVSSNASIPPSRRIQVRMPVFNYSCPHVLLECTCQCHVSELATRANPPELYLSTDAPNSPSP